MAAIVLLLSEPFDSAAQFSVVDADGLSVSFFSDGYHDYFGINNGPGASDFGTGADDPPSGAPAYTGFSGSYLEAEDVDGEGAEEPFTLTWGAVSGSCSGQLAFSGKFAEDGNAAIDIYDYVQVKLAIDGGAATTILEFRGNDDDRYNGAFAVDTDGDGLGDGTVLTLAAQTFTVGGLGPMSSSFVLSVVIKVDASNEEIAMDDLQVSCSGAGEDASPSVPPSPSPSPSPPTAPPPVATPATLYEINYVAGEPCDASPLEGVLVTTTGYVSAVDSSAFYMQSDPAGSLWGGIYVYCGPSPACGLDVRVVGELVEVTGEVLTYFGLTEIVDPLVSGDGSAVATMAPLAVTTGELGTAASCSGEQYEGLLVTVSNPTLLSEPSNYGEITIDDGSGETQLEDGLLDTDSHLETLVGGTLTGTVLASLTGVVKYAFQSFEIHPRSAADIVVAPAPITGGDPITTFQGREMRYWLSTKHFTPILEQGPIVVSQLAGPANPPSGLENHKGAWVMAMEVDVAGVDKIVIEAVDPATLLAHPNATVAPATADALTTMRLSVSGKQLAAGEHKLSIVDATITVSAKRVRSKRRIGIGWMEQITIEAGGLGLRITSAKANKFADEEHQVLGLHLDLEFLSFDESAVRGALPEMWGLQPMTEKTKLLLDQKNADS